MYHMNGWQKNSYLKQSIVKNNTCIIFANDYGFLASTSADLIISECIFLNNRAYYTFTANYHATITVIDCIVDLKTATSSSDGRVDLDQVETEFFKLELSLSNCESHEKFSYECIANSKKTEKITGKVLRR